MGYKIILSKMGLGERKVGYVVNTLLIIHQTPLV